MDRIRLNGWERIGVVLAGGWVIYVLLLGVAGYQGTPPFGRLIKGETKTVVVAPPQCVEKSQENVVEEAPRRLSFEEFRDLGACGEGFEVSVPSRTEIRTTPDRVEFSLWPFVLAAVVPPIAAWIFVLFAVRVTRWVVAGFRGSAT